MSMKKHHKRSRTHGPRIYLAYDAGRDVSVLRTVRRMADGRIVKWRATYIGLTLAEQVEALCWRCTEPRVMRCVIDRAGIGAVLADELRLRIGSKVKNGGE